MTKLWNNYRLFETHPETKDVFLAFKNISPRQLEENAELRAHGLRVMGTVEKFLARINNEEKLRSLLHDLGRRHASYNAEAKFIPVRINYVIMYA